MERFDLVVIGAGPSGYAAAMRAIDFKKKNIANRKIEGWGRWRNAWGAVV